MRRLSRRLINRKSLCETLMLSVHGLAGFITTGWTQLQGEIINDIELKIARVFENVCLAVAKLGT